MAKNKLTEDSIFDSFQKLRRDANVPLDSFEWFRKTINENIRVSKVQHLRDQIISDPTRNSKRRLFEGFLYFFFYNEPEYKTTLPFYDTFPLVLLLSREKSSFFGINFHYIPPKRRLFMFMQLQKYRQNNRIMLPYSKMIKDKKWKIFKSCFRQYNIKRIQGNCINIPAEDWPIAINLPVERFKKVGKKAIWSNTLTEEMS